ncbi:MAG TPA: TetR/AcrR family transcriptional regulator [bacterium]
MNESENIGMALSRKEREKQIRQQHILDAARELFIRKGYHQTTLEEIARQAEFGKGTLYNYFRSKEDLFSGIIDRLSDDMFERTQTALAAPGDVREKMTAYAKAFISHAQANSDLFRLIIQELHQAKSPQYKAKLKSLNNRTQASLELIARLIEGEIGARKIRPFDPLKLVALFDGMLRWYCINVLENHLHLPLDDIDTTVDFIVSVFFDGVTEK